MILNVLLYSLMSECARLLELDSSASVVSGMSHYEKNQTAESYSSQSIDKTKADTSVAVAVICITALTMKLF